MNERILEIARESGLLVHNPAGVPTKLEKFAELIVEECLNLVDHGGEFVSRPKLVERIKEHFGIEE